MAQQPSQIGKPMFRGSPPRFVGYSDGTKMPQFTKRDYVVIAAAINAAWRQQNLLPDRDYQAGISAAANKIAEAFKADNSRFDIFKFVEACTK